MCRALPGIWPDLFGAGYAGLGWLGRYPEGSAKFLASFNRDEPIGWVKIVLARLVNDAEHTGLAGFRSGEGHIDLAEFQRRREALVPHAHDVVLADWSR
jgi:hypothetical protein